MGHWFRFKGGWVGHWFWFTCNGGVGGSLV